MLSASTTATNPPRSTGQTGSEGFDDDAQRQRVLVVDSAGHRLAIPVERVREVQRTARVTTVPGSPPVLHGIANVRGAVVTVLDLAVALQAQLPPAEDAHIVRTASRPRVQRGEKPGSIVLLEHGSQVIGLLVDAVREVPARDDAPLAPPSVAAHLESSAFMHAPLAGVVRAEGEDIALLDVDALFSRYLLSTE